MVHYLDMLQAIEHRKYHTSESLQAFLDEVKTRSYYNIQAYERVVQGNAEWMMTHPLEELIQLVTISKLA